MTESFLLAAIALRTARPEHKKARYQWMIIWLFIFIMHNN
jgi:hypothetical protein